MDDTHKIPKPHDRAFKKAMSHLSVAREFFAHHLPDNVKKTVDLQSLKLCGESFFGIYKV